MYRLKKNKNLAALDIAWESKLLYVHTDLTSDKSKNIGHHQQQLKEKKKNLQNSRHLYYISK